MATPLIGEPRAKVEPANRPSSISEQTSAGPNCSAARTKSGDRKIISVMPQEAPTKEANTVKPERDAAAALLGHREAVETRHRVRRVARQIEQDGADRAAILRAVHDAAQHQDGGDRLHAEGQRQQDRDGGERAHAGQHADHVADQHADEAEHQIVRLERDAEAVPEVRQCGRDHRPPLHVNIGIGTCRKYENNPTPKMVTTVARMIVPFHVAPLSPSAAIKTQANVPGAIPK